MNKNQIRRLIFYTIIAFMISVPTPEPYNSMTFYSLNVPSLVISLFVIVGGWIVISLEVKQ